jgi:hypothetical protein
MMSPFTPRWRVANLARRRPAMLERRVSERQWHPQRVQMPRRGPRSLRAREPARRELESCAATSTELLSTSEQREPMDTCAHHPRFAHQASSQHPTSPHRAAGAGSSSPPEGACLQHGTYLEACLRRDRRFRTRRVCETGSVGPPRSSATVPDREAGRGSVGDGRHAWRAGKPPSPADFLPINGPSFVKELRRNMR